MIGVVLTELCSANCKTKRKDKVNTHFTASHDIMGLSRVSGRYVFTLKAPSFTASVCPRQVGEQRGRWVFGADMSVEQRFWDKVDKSDGCWEWGGTKITVAMDNVGLAARGF